MGRFWFFVGICVVLAGYVAMYAIGKQSHDADLRSEDNDKVGA